MKVDGYDIDIVIQGYPGKAVCHGGLGWSSVVLLRGHGRVALIDTGSFGLRPLLKPRLKARGLEPKDVTDLLLTHSHHDHSVNWTLFRHARICIGAHELAWSLEEPWGETPVPELYVRELKTWPLLDGFRGRPKADVDALVTSIAAFSHMAAQLGGRLVEAEINPLFVLPLGRGVKAADGVVVLAQ